MLRGDAFVKPEEAGASRDGLEDAGCFYAAVLRLEYFDCNSPNLEADPGFGNVLEMFQDQAVESLGAVER